MVFIRYTVNALLSKLQFGRFVISNGKEFQNTGKYMYILRLNGSNPCVHITMMVFIIRRSLVTMDFIIFTEPAGEAFR